MLSFNFISSLFLIVLNEFFLEQDSYEVGEGADFVTVTILREIAEDVPGIPPLGGAVGKF